MNSRLYIILIAILIISTSAGWFGQANLYYKQKLLIDEKNATLSEKELISEERDTLAEENKSLTETITSLRNQLESFSKESEAKILAIQKQLKESQGEKEAVQGRISDYENAQQQFKKEKTGLEQKIRELNQKIALLQAPPPISPAATQTPAETQTPAPSAPSQEVLREKDKLIQQLREENEILQKRLDEITATVQKRFSEINVARMALEESIAQARDQIHQQYQTVNLGSVAVSSEMPKTPKQTKNNFQHFKSSDQNKKSKTKTSPVSKPQPITLPLAKTDTAATPQPRETTVKADENLKRILSINDRYQFLVIEGGRDGNLKSSDKLTVVRDGEKIADLEVIEIRDKMTACNIKNLRTGVKLDTHTDLVQIQHVQGPSSSIAF